MRGCGFQLVSYGRFDAVGEMPAFWALQDGERGFQTNGWWGLRVIEKDAVCFERAGGEVEQGIVQRG
jgi:hypothetical protein